MVGLLGNREPQGTLAGSIQGFTPIPMQAMSNQAVMDYAKNVASSARQNMAQQMSDLDKALVMDQGGINVGDRQALARLMEQIPGLMGATAYHGTPHTIRGKFDVSKIGSGEGNQAFGHGMYFAENPKVAETYAGLSPASGSYPSMRRSINGVEVEIGSPEAHAATLLKGNNLSLKEAKNLVKSWINDPGAMSADQNVISGWQKTLNTLNAITKKSDVKDIGTGNIYKVDIPDAYIPTMMDWDKPLGQQSTTVQKAINSIKSKITPEMKDELGGDLNLLFGKDVTPNQFLNTLEIIHPESITGIGEKWLNDAGVKGIRYLDNTSRNAGKGTSNFVVFDPSEVKILEKNKKKVEGLLE
jgi:hypothetical protein